MTAHLATPGHWGKGLGSGVRGHALDPKPLTLDPWVNP